MGALWPYLILLVALAFPSANYQYVNGLPFSTWPEFLALALILPFFLIRDLRSAASGYARRLRIPTRVFCSAGVLIVLMKIVLLLSGSREGFAACYSSPAEWAATAGDFPAPAGCERSYEDIFGLSKATRLDRSVDFGKDSWNLVFLNTSRYDYYDWQDGAIPRDRIPLAVRWEGPVDIPADARVVIRYAGEGTLQIGPESVVLPASYDEVREIPVDLPAGRMDFTLDYRFDDGSRTGQAAGFGPRAQVHVLLSGPDGAVPLSTSGPEIFWSVLAFLADAFLLIFLLFLLPAFLPDMRSSGLEFFLFAGYLLLVYILPLPAWIRELAMTAGLFALWAWHIWLRRIPPALSFAAILLASLAITRLWLPSLNSVTLHSAGNDPLGFESQAYAILANGSLEGGEAVFYAQPMSRYLIFAGHALWGDGNAPLAISGLALFFGAVVFLSHPLAGGTRSRGRNAVILVSGAAVWLLGGYYVSGVIRAGLPDPVAWSLLLLTLPLLFRARSAPAILAGFALMGLSYTIRANQLPAILWILFWASVALWRRNRKIVLAGIALAVFIGLLPLAHNLYFGRQFVLSTTSAGNAANLTLPPSVWLSMFRGDPAAALGVREQVGMLFLFSDADRSQWPTLLGMGILLVQWIGICMYSAAARKISWWPILAVPILYLAPHLFFVVNTYYPRHIAIGYLAMAASVWLVFQRGKDPYLPSAVKSS